MFGQLGVGVKCPEGWILKPRMAGRQTRMQKDQYKYSSLSAQRGTMLCISFGQNLEIVLID